MGLIKNNLVVDTENGIVRDKYGQLVYYIEFNENETYLEYRNKDGDIIDYFKSGEIHSSPDDKPKSMKEKYRNWKYYE